jgi:glycosyltransferase involved in cell wall biosynthesis
MSEQQKRLRVAFVAGNLGLGGAEKQLVYMARSLREAGVDVRVYTLTRGDFYDSALRAIGIEPIWVGRHANTPMRLAALTIALRQFRPHILQSGHFYTNLYTTVAGEIWRAVSIGAIRNDTLQDIELNGGWGRWLLRLPPVLIANSYVAKQNAEALGKRSAAVRVVPNVIDLTAFDQRRDQHAARLVQASSPVAIAVATFKAQKRLDRFLAALALARRELPNLQGILIGEGSERPYLEGLANNLGLIPDGLRMLGRRDDVPALLGQATMLVLSSDHEGFPNVLLEAMAAGLPVITTPAGDAGTVTQNGVTGYVTPFDDIDAMAKRMVRLARSPELCRSLGEAGRRRVEQLYGFDGLADRLLSTYRAIAEQYGDRRLRAALWL